MVGWRCGAPIPGVQNLEMHMATEVQVALDALEGYRAARVALEAAIEAAFPSFTDVMARCQSNHPPQRVTSLGPHGREPGYLRIRFASGHISSVLITDIVGPA